MQTARKPALEASSAWWIKSLAKICQLQAHRTFLASVSMAMPTEELFQWFAGELAEERATLAPWLDLPLSSSLVGQKR